ncbi:MAG TPA: hypothetical protein VKU85_08610 [bacterium]|nr:hypothetical protein [bacterium]
MNRLHTLPPVLPVLIAALLLAAPAAAQTEAIWGTRPDAVMIAVYAQYDEESDVRLWHKAAASVQAQNATSVRLELEGGPTLYLPVSAGESSAATADQIRAALGQLVRLEYHPVVDAPRGAVHASWTWSVSRQVAGEGNVPMTNPLYSAMLRQLGDDVPKTGVFAPLARAQLRLDILVRNVTNGNGREVDELADGFLKAAEYAGLPLNFYKLPDGTRASEEEIEEIKHRGYVLSAVDYWNAAISKFRQNRIVSPSLNDFEAAWAKVRPGTKVMVDMPGLGRRALSDDLLHQFRRMAGQKYLDAAFSAAKAGDPEWTNEMLRRLAEERQSSGLPMGELRLEGRQAVDEDIEYLVKLARGETGFVGFFRAIWHRILEEAVPGAPPV